MRYAVVSDIHGNIEALDAVLERAGEGTRLLCLGDVVGYGPSPNECVARLRERGAEAVLGNHDVAAIDNFGLQYFNPAARAAIEWTQGVLQDDHVHWLSELSYEIRRPAYLMVHGAPVTYFAYILDKAAAAVAFGATDAPLIFVGHTHIAEYYAQRADGTIEHRHMQQGGTLALEPQQRYLVNVGSVGQPRDLNPEASFAIYDDQRQTVTWERVAYAIDVVREKIGAVHLPEMLGERLLSGR
ncbi:MAG TPA: metallophosphoesterase family protein [Candidatus Acidoferrales bacterium]|nr:metallophosphoesterase family protein [Candidatus Acidoferrales bacterium]